MDETVSSRHPIRLEGFLGGVFLTQIVDSALHLAQPLLLAKISGSLGGAAFFSAFDTAVHMAGTYLGDGPPTVLARGVSWWPPLSCARSPWLGSRS